MADLRLEEQDFVRVAHQLGVEVAAIKAVQEVETGGRGGFYDSGRPKILFEGHIFWKQLTNRKLSPESFVAGNENILYKSWTRQHYLSGEREYERLEKAMMVDEEAALASASWGMFQVMGFNYEVCGYKGVREFVEAMKQSEGTQLDAFAGFVRGSRLIPYLVNKDWKNFACRYNGPGYAENHYDEKLDKAYRKYI